MPQSSQSGLGQAKPRVGTDFLHPRGMIGSDIPWLHDLQTDLMATSIAVMRRGRLPLALFEGFPALVESFVPTIEICLEQPHGDEQSDEVG